MPKPKKIDFESFLIKKEAQEVSEMAPSDVPYVEEGGCENAAPGPSTMDPSYRRR